MIRVYRVRRPLDGAGPDFQEKWTTTWHGNAKHRPTPCHDPGLQRYPAGEVCAFTTLKAVYRWFGRGNLTRLYAMGFRIESALVPNTFVDRGKHQCLVLDSKKVHWCPILVSYRTERGSWKREPIRPDSF